MNAIFSTRLKDINRTTALFDFDPSAEESDFKEQPTEEEDLKLSKLQHVIRCAGLKISPASVIVLCLLTASILSIVASRVLSPYLLPIVVIVGAYLPLSWIDARATKRAADFNADYPTILLATASSIKVGMTPLTALERGISLLPEGNLVRAEVEKLLGELRIGRNREIAVRNFGSSIRQPDLDLFRSAFLLALENGGRFAPTLERLARVSKERSVLISSAATSTATMGMTANILLVVAPVITSIIAARTENYWSLLIQHPVANAVASVGITIIICSYFIMRKMSDFRP